MYDQFIYFLSHITLKHIAFALLFNLIVTFLYAWILFPKALKHIKAFFIFYLKTFIYHFVFVPLISGFVIGMCQIFKRIDESFEKTALPYLSYLIEFIILSIIIALTIFVYMKISKKRLTVKKIPGKI